MIGQYRPKRVSLIVHVLMPKKSQLEINLLEKYQQQVLHDQIKKINIFLNNNMVNFKETLELYLFNYLIVT